MTRFSAAYSKARQRTSRVLSLVELVRTLRWLSDCPGLFQSFPYLLPTVMAGLILVIGAVLACFLSWDGGVRGGSRIALAVEKNEPLLPAPPENNGSPAPSHLTAVPSLTKKRSILSPGADPEAAANGAGYPGLSSSYNPRRDSRASLGTAYGCVDCIQRS